jgi:hypothetical protein
MLRLLIASVAGLTSFFLIFWFFTWVTGSNDIGALIALPLGFLGVPALILKFRRSSGGGIMRNRISGAIGVVWGGAILIFGFLRGGPEGTGAYANGQGAGFIFGVLLFAIGLYYLVKGDAKKGAQQ